MAGDFNLFVDSKLDAQGGNPVIKKKSLAKLIDLKESYDLCDIWRVRNMTSRRFAFTQKYSSGFIQRGLDYIFISNTAQELVTTTEILTPISTDHSTDHSCSLLSFKKKRLSQRYRILEI